MLMQTEQTRRMTMKIHKEGKPEKSFMQASHMQPKQQQLHHASSTYFTVVMGIKRKFKKLFTILFVLVTFAEDEDILANGKP
jgi:hypothetical protein